MSFLILSILLAVFAKDFPPVTTSIVRAIESGDTAAIRQGLEALKSIEPAQPRERELVLYTIGYAEYQSAYLPGVSAEERKSVLADAQKQFEAVVKLNADNAEAHALLATVVGAQIAFYRGRAMEMGMQSSEEFTIAERLEPNNPRVLLLDGISTLHKPEEYGGGAQNAEPLLRRAVQLFAAEPADRPWPNWGHADAHIWLGQVLEKSGKRDAARAEYETAQKLAPQSRFAQAMLKRSQKIP